MPYCSADACVLFESGECGRVEDIGYEAHACVPEESLRCGDGDSSGFLPAVLLGIEAGV